MLQITTILYATDFSPLSEHAFHLACSLARDHNSRLIILHVAEPPVVRYGEGSTTPGSGWKAKEEQLRRIQAADTAIPVEHRLEEGEPADEILRVAKETNSDLIVMGTHGRSGVGRLLMGSVSEEVMRQANCPVLVVKTPIPEKPVP